MENMKKIVVLLLGLFGWMQIASAQIFDRDTMEEVNSKFAVDWKIGALGVFDFMPNSCVGVSILYDGFYLDFMFSPTKHLQNTRIDKWKDGRGYAFHFGYQLPFSESFRCVPMIGLAKIEMGITDGYDWTYSDGVRNKFVPEKTSGGLDYGLTLIYNFMWIMPVNATLTASRYALTAGIGFEF
ncbi:hypothetical protein SAMN02745171_01466 [Porphyromonas circumdentaria]|uniref:Outer membrane protein beta-barrel domain-containing protein n=2 Tax=Porphyromonas circumdentaria TaxID=29524 RepID=A0A1T4PGL7_9PORP|nr:hypothetical protein SAMN02745171_01466 [Porphyromonas circumdentaria]